MRGRTPAPSPRALPRQPRRRCRAACRRYPRESVCAYVSSREVGSRRLAAIEVYRQPLTAYWLLFRHDRRFGLIDIGHAKQILGWVDQPVDHVAEAPELRR